MRRASLDSGTRKSVSGDGGQRSPCLKRVPPTALPSRQTTLPSYDLKGLSLRAPDIGVDPELSIRTSSEARHRDGSARFDRGQSATDEPSLRDRQNVTLLSL